jgi:hypothetical protein
MANTLAYYEKSNNYVEKSLIVQARVSVYDAWLIKQYSLLGPFLSYEENEML